MYDCVLNSIDNIGDESFLIECFIIEGNDGPSLLVCQELGAHRLLHYYYWCFVWECSPFFIFKVAGDIWYVDYILKCTATCSTTSMATGTSLDLYDSSAISSAYYTAIKTFNSYIATVNYISGIYSLIPKASWWVSI